MTTPGAPVSAPSPRKAPCQKCDLAVALACGAFVGLMVGAAYAAVPVYTWFCRVTGFGGTPQVASLAPSEVLDRRITVRFDANIGRGLPWRFAPEAASVDVRLGEVATVYYTVTNLAARETSGTAAYNVAPTQIGAYFAKINCFCFSEQRLKAGETREMAVVFFVDPALAKDPDLNELVSITLSYTFYPTREPATARTGGS
jgi:cytochrome c oxidase assembly protein subunit 11